MITPKEVLAVEFFDVVGGYTDAYYAWHNTEFGTKIDIEHITSPDKRLVTNVDSQTHLERIETFMFDHFDLIQPVAGARGALRRLATRYELHLVTAGHVMLAETVTNWLERHDLMYFSMLHTVDNFHYVDPHGLRMKLEKCRRIGATRLIEKADNYALEAAEGGISVVMPALRWNGQVTHERITRLPSWGAIALHLAHAA